MTSAYTRYTFTFVTESIVAHITPELSAQIRECWEWTTGRRRVPFPHAARTLSRFVRWLGRHLAPPLSRLDHAMVELEFRASATMRPLTEGQALLAFALPAGRIVTMMAHLEWTEE